MVGPAPGSVPWPPGRRRLVTGLFIFAAAVIVASAESFADSLITTGTQLGIDRFLPAKAGGHAAASSRPAHFSAMPAGLSGRASAY